MSKVFDHLWRNLRILILRFTGDTLSWISYWCISNIDEPGCVPRRYINKLVSPSMTAEPASSQTSPISPSNRYPRNYETRPPLRSPRRYSIRPLCVAAKRAGESERWHAQVSPLLYPRISFTGCSTLQTDDRKRRIVRGRSSQPCAQGTGGRSQ